MKILVIGDSCLDIYHYGTVKRLNPEAPVPIINVERTESRPGMAGNVHNNLLALGALAHQHTPERIGAKSRYIDSRSGYQLLRVDEEVTCEPYKIEDYRQFDALVVSDYNKGFVTIDTLARLRSRFDGPIYVDSKKTYLPAYENMYYKVNEHEYENLTNAPKNLVVTLGANGCRYGGVVYEAPRVEVVDVCGAGDVFLAAMTYFHLKHKDIAIALNLANQCAAASCRHVGCHTLAPGDLQSISI
jgi:D-beta-D-heptose 7-phosphate kinase/D-beta-D-heptose 1-phosphate adenosyltransferase